MKKLMQFINKRELIIVLLIIALFTTASLSIGLVRHYSFDSQYYDFGIFDESLWKFSRLTNPIIPTKGFTHIWGDHFNPSIFTLVPFYWLTNGQWIVFLLQTLFISLSSWFIYQISKIKIKNSIFRISLVFSFLFYVGIQNAMFTDIHNMVFAVLPLTLAFWALYKNHNAIYWLSLLWFLGWQENAAGIGLALGIYLMFSRKTRKKGLITAILSFIWGLFSIKLIIPHFLQQDYYYNPIIPTSIQDAVNKLFFPRIKLKTIILSFASFGWLPLLHPQMWVVIGEQYIERFVLNNAATRWDLGMHYNAILTPLFTISCIEVVKKYLKKDTHISMVGVIIILSSLVIGLKIKPGPLLLSYRKEFHSQIENNKHYKEFLNKIPKNKGLIMTNNNLAAHLTQHEVILLNKYYEKYDPKVIAIYTRSGQNPNNFFPLGEEKSNELIKILTEGKEYVELEGVKGGEIFYKD